MSPTEQERYEDHLLISFECPSCGEPFDAEVENAHFDWTDDSPDEGVTTADSVVVCPDCSEEEVVFVTATSGGKEVVLRDHPKVMVRFRDDAHDDHGYDSGIGEYTPYDAGEVFHTSMTELGEVAIPPDGTARQVVLKMLYLQSVVALEAYLSDRLIKIVIDDEEKLIQLVKRNETFRNTALTLGKLADDKDFMKNHVKKYLRDFSFHKLKDVAKFYKSILNVDIFDDDAEASELDAVIVRRHHIVHRNGRDNDDNQIDISLPELKRAQLLCREMVARIEASVERYRAYRYFEHLEQHQRD